MRAGYHCAEPLIKALHTNSTVRASTYFYNTENEIDRFIEAINLTKEFFLIPMDINEIYQRTIMDYAIKAHNNSLLSGLNTYQISLNNPTCGDELTLSVLISNDKVCKIAYQADGCVIFKAATAMMDKICLGRSISEIKRLEYQFSQMMMQKDIDDIENLGDAIALQSVVKLPVRIKCAMLPWKAIYQVLNEGENNAR